MQAATPTATTPPGRVAQRHRRQWEQAPAAMVAVPPVCRRDSRAGDGGSAATAPIHMGEAGDVDWKWIARKANGRNGVE